MLNPVDSSVIAAALGKTDRAVRMQAEKYSWPYSELPVRGGRKRLYDVAVLPEDIQPKVLLYLRSTGVLKSVAKSEQQKNKESSSDQKAKEPKSYTWTAKDSDALWVWANSRSQKQRDEGAFRAELLQKVADLLLTSETLTVRQALAAVAAYTNESESNLRRWWYSGSGRGAINQYPRNDWAALLIPSNSGRSSRKEIDDRAWDWFTAYYLTRRQPTMAEAYRRTCETASANGWGLLPSQDTFTRRLEEIPMAQRVYLREGAEALGRMFPPQRRDKSMFEAGEAVSGDGLKFDRLWVKFPDGEIINTATGWFWQDLRTNKILAYRLAKTENTDLFRLATYDLVGITVPRFAIIDNTRVAANKAMTGRAAGRHRFKNRPEDPLGLLQMLGIEPKFTNPDKVLGSPGAKPIERSFGIGGIHDKVATHPTFLNRGFSSKTAISFEEFSEIVAEEVARFNAQTGRKTPFCMGVLSFDQAFAESFSQAEVRRVSEAQRNLLLLMPEVVRVGKDRAEVRLKAGSGPWGAHRYWTEALANLAGEQVVVYYDPENLTRDVSVYRLDGRFYTVANHMVDVGVSDTVTAREYGRHKAGFVKDTKRAAERKKRMTAIEMAALYPSPEEVNIPEPGIVRPNFGQNLQVEEGLVTSRRVVGSDFTPDDGYQGAEHVQAGERRVLDMLDAMRKSQTQI